MKRSSSLTSIGFSSLLAASILTLSAVAAAMNEQGGNDGFDSLPNRASSAAALVSEGIADRTSSQTRNGATNLETSRGKQTGWFSLSSHLSAPTSNLFRNLDSRSEYRGVKASNSGTSFNGRLRPAATEENRRYGYHSRKPPLVDSELLTHGVMPMNMSMNSDSNLVRKLRPTSALAAKVPASIAVTGVAASRREILLRWDAPSDGGSAITGYLVRYRTDEESVWSTIPTLPSFARETKLTQLKAGTRYQYFVSALNSVGIGEVPAVQLSAGSSHSCALLSDGHVSCWGENSWGQLGSEGADISMVPRVTNLEDVIQISTHSYHTCALTAIRIVKCWGSNPYGQLGNGSTVNSVNPVQVADLSDVSSIDTGGNATCALLKNQTVKCWGHNGSGMLGDGTTQNSTTPVTVDGITSAIAIDVGGHMACAILADRTAKCWGGSAGKLPTVVPELTDVLQISVGGQHTCALILGGNVKCWGSNRVGQLGLGLGVPFGGPDRLSPVMSKATDIRELYTGFEHTCGLAKNSVLFCWGKYDQGILTDDRKSPTAVASEVTSVTTSDGHTCFMTRLGQIQCWGDNSYGELGLPAGNYQPNPVRLASFNAVSRETTADGAPASSPVLKSMIWQGSTLQLKWDRPFDDGGADISDYIIEYSANVGNNWGSWTKWQDEVSTSTSATISGLQPGGFYQFRIAALTSLGPGAWWVASPIRLFSAPTGIQGLTSTSFPTASLTFTWRGVDWGGSVGNYQYRIWQAGKPTPTKWTSVPSKTSRQVVIRQLIKGKRYNFEVRAVNAKGPGKSFLVRNVLVKK